ncbi:MAG: formate--tetrahydrofolate ligase [Erysipelotrichales bacterium]|nr:formate--tetrahydrofolate ligase [Erysipelotrichales bacterium]
MEENLWKISDVAKKAKIPEKYLEPYGFYKAKINMDIMNELKNRPNGKLVLVTAITPTKAGEGKTTTSIALADGLAHIKKNCMLVLREPSLGPVFGIKGGATGGGKVCIAPSEDINLHFTGDMHALTSSINLISAVIDNHIFQGNELNIDPNKVVWKRALDMNDRALREITIAQGKGNGVVRQDGFVITVASELMAILCLAENPDDFMERVNKITVAYTYDDTPITVKDLKISKAILKLMKEALKPNLVQTLEHNPCLIHGGPFANIAHGCNSIIATKLGLKLGDIVVTEAGFGADLGAEKFLDIKCRFGGLKPDMAVMVATIRALKTHGGVEFDNLKEENVEAMLNGCANLERHLENIKKFGLPFVVAINHFADDTENEVKALTQWCKERNYPVSFLDGFLKGGEGAIDLANKVAEVLDTKKSNYHPLYDVNLSIKEKIRKIAKEIYRAEDVVFLEDAEKHIKKFEDMGFSNTPVCIAKTPQSFTDNAKIIGAPNGFTLTVRDVTLSSGAGFVVALTGNILTMPGLPKVPAAVKMEDM